MEKLVLMEKKRMRLRELRRDMRGINPRLSIYERMERECESIIRELETLGATKE